MQLFIFSRKELTHFGQQQWRILAERRVVICCVLCLVPNLQILVSIAILLFHHLRNNFSRGLSFIIAQIPLVTPQIFDREGKRHGSLQLLTSAEFIYVSISGFFTDKKEIENSETKICTISQTLLYVKLFSIFFCYDTVVILNFKHYLVFSCFLLDIQNHKQKIV